MKITILLLLPLIATAAQSSWRYYPINSVESGVVTQGLQIYVSPPCVFTVAATTQNGDEAPITTTRTIDSSPAADGGFFPLRIVDLDHFRVLRITITIAGRSATYDNPASGTLHVTQ